jgi:hypothetical protein
MSLVAVSAVALDGIDSSIAQAVGSATAQNLQSKVTSIVTKTLHTNTDAVFINTVEATRAKDGYTSIDAARTLEELNIPWVGVRSRYLNHNIEDIKMLAFYGDLPVANFSVLSLEHLRAVPSGELIPLPKGLNFPVTLRLVVAPHSDTLERRDTHVALSNAKDFDAAVREALSTIPRVVVEEDISANPLVSAFCYTDHVELDGLKTRQIHTVVGSGVVDPLVVEQLQSMGMTILRSFADGIGYAIFYGRVIAESSPPKKEADGVEAPSELKPKVYFDSVNFTPSLSTVRSSFFGNEAAGWTRFVNCATNSAKTLFSFQQPNYRVSFDASDKGYFMKAERDMKKGDIVFEDEGRAFTVVTRPHVMKHWSAEDKVVFSRFAWPLDDGHVYVTWDDSPKKWRPINHSCDPNLIFAEGHSLNVIASRDIKKGDDLTLDYATFCDFSMKPFQCFCKTSHCRGMIQPNEAALAKYGTNAWHRKMPSEAAGQV